MAENGDKVTIDFVGKVGGEVFQGGSAQDIDIVLGSGSFIPGFEDQIVGMKVGEERTINVTFPEAYGEASLAGKPAEFAVTLKAVAAPGELAIDDEFAKGLGFESSGEAARNARGLRSNARRASCRAASGSASCSMRSTRNMRSNCRKSWSRANSTLSGARPRRS